jgi:hypothetical protein
MTFKVRADMLHACVRGLPEWLSCGWLPLTIIRLKKSTKHGRVVTVVDRRDHTRRATRRIEPSSYTDDEMRCLTYQIYLDLAKELVER